MLIKKIFSGFCVCLLSIPIAFGQKPGNITETEKSNRLNYQSKIFLQAEELNDSLLKESIKLSIRESSLLYANLAKIWKPQDFSRSQKFIEKAISEASPSLNDTTDERKEKLATLQELLPISVQISDLSAKKIIDLLKAEDKKQPGQNLETSKALAEAALTVIKNNPRAGFDLAVAALRLTEKPSDNPAINRIIFSLATVDKKLAEDFFLQVLNYSQAAKDSKSIGDIVLYSSPASNTAQLDFLSVEAKKLVLSVFLEDLLGYAALLQQNQLSAEQKELACDLFLRGKGIEEVIKNYLPEKAIYISQISQQAQLCRQAFSSPAAQDIADELSADRKELSVEELIQAAFDSKDAGKKAFYLAQAIGKLSVTKQYEKILALLDGMNDDTKRALGAANDFLYWRMLRHSYARDAVLQEIRDDDFSSAQRIIEKTPLDLRPSLQISVGREILKNLKKADFSNPLQIFAFNVIADARKNLLKTDDPFASVDLYLSLINLYAVLQPDEVAAVFRETIKAINQADEYKNEEKYKGKDYFYGRDIINQPVLSLENINDLSYQIANIRKPYSRVRIKLGMLESVLKKYIDIKEENKQINENRKIFDFSGEIYVA